MIPAVDYIRILPELVLSIFGILVMLVDPLIPEQSPKKPLGLIALVGVLAGLAATAYQTSYYGSAFYNTISVDTFSVFFHVVVLLIALVVILTSFEYLEVQRIRSGEYYGLILFGTVGMMLMSSAVELVLVFIALEISSISTYILAGMRRRAAESAEASLKYFLLGSFATAFFLYGVALIYGATGTTNVYGIAHFLQTQQSPLAYLAVGLMFVGLGFKVAAAPFHVWTPDVYEGSPAPVVALMSTGPKAAAFAVLLRVLFATDCAGLVLDGVGRSSAVDDAGQHRRAGAAERQAPAGLLIDCTRRIYSGRFRRGANRGNLGGDLLCRFLRRHERGRVRCGQPLRVDRRKIRHAR